MKDKLTLSELNERIRDTLLEAFPSTVWVIAEVSELKENRSGHCYMELVEKQEDEIVARSRATIWSYTYRMLKPYFETTTGQLFTNGIKILVQASVEFHPAFGLSLNIKDIEPTYTVGDMALHRKEIIDRLVSEGVFDMNRELRLPLVPQKIAVISSATAAGYQDFINQLENNEHGFKFYTQLFEAWMQGQGAVSSVIKSLERIYQFEDFFDAVAIIRGGGATADLSSFDSYELALNIAQFPLPVITGIGHEKDDTVIDLVAHTRMKTPTAVAEFFVSGVERFYNRLIDLESDIIDLIRERVEYNQLQLERMANKIHQSASYFLRIKNESLTKTGNQLQMDVGQYSFSKTYEINNLKHAMQSAVSIWSVETKNNINQKRRILKRVAGEVMLNEKNKIDHLMINTSHFSKERLYKEQKRIHFSENAMRLLTPENVLKRGYTITMKKGKIVKSKDQLGLRDEIETLFADGKVKSKIIKK